MGTRKMVTIKWLVFWHLFSCRNWFSSSLWIIAHLIRVDQKLAFDSPPKWHGLQHKLMQHPGFLDLQDSDWDLKSKADSPVELLVKGSHPCSGIFLTVHVKGMASTEPGSNQDYFPIVSVLMVTSGFLPSWLWQCIIKCYTNNWNENCNLFGKVLMTRDNSLKQRGSHVYWCKICSCNIWRNKLAFLKQNKA